MIGSALRHRALGRSPSRHLGWMGLVVLVPLLVPTAALSQEGEALRAFDYLNRVRQNPGAFSGEIGIDLSDVPTRPALRWNRSLAVAAQRKADDMAARNYMGHVTPEGLGMNVWIHEAGYELSDAFLTNPADNYFESLSAGLRSGQAVIKLLILDEGVPGAGHRKHLLGLNDFWANALDVGIAVATKEASDYGHYWVVLIAKHDH